MIEKLDKMLGGMILAAGAGAGIAAVGPAALAPLGMFAAVWGWVEQKDTAIGLLGQAISAVSGKLAGTAGRDRRELIAAAHTVIVVAAFFEAFREHVGKDFYDQLKITDEEKEALIARSSHGWRNGLYEHLYAAEVPAPSAMRGFEENTGQIKNWYSLFVEYFSPFIRGLAAGENTQVAWISVIGLAVKRYRSHFLVLAAKVPEFMIWALLGEGAATRSAVAGLRTDFTIALDGTRDALRRLEALLAIDTQRGEDMLDHRQALAWANSGILAEKIIPEDAQSYGGIEFPTVGESYVNPRYRMAPATDREEASERQAGESARPSDEHWWDGLRSRDDFDLMLAAHVTSPDATRLPMLLLGHPGAGKSMLAKVFAARLPASAYTVVRVPLRRVGANAPLVNQIERALHEATNGRVDSWWRLAERSADTDRVVLLDGLDELLQASQADRSGYLQEVMEFQRLEAEQQRPVVVVVTSRTVVADRVDIPRGTIVVKLDMFEESDIADWLDRWQQVNATAIVSGKMRALTVDALIRGSAHGPMGGQETNPGDNSIEEARSILELARQPLLLLMLALYTADPAVPPLDADLATADLYQRLLESFSRREAAKALEPNTRRDDLDDRVQDHLERLAIAALAMFNRGRQDISEKELGADLDALDPRLKERSQPAEVGQRIIGEFFFVHAAEARQLTGPVELEADTAAQPSRREPPRRSYEFLHATFGEYLVASRLISELVDVAAKAFAGRRGLADPDDDLLYALLTHQVLAARKSTLTFAEEIYSSMPGEDRGHVLEVLEILLGSYRHRHGSNRYAAYRPIPQDRLRELACYSANLVALRAMLEPDGGRVPLTKLLHTTHNALEQWRSTVMLWKCGLDGDGMQSILATLKLSDNPPAIRVGAEHPASLVHHSVDPILIENEISLARLVGDRAMEERLRYGIAITDRYIYAYNNSNWMHVMASWLIPAIAGKRIGRIISEPPEGTSTQDISTVAGLIFQYLRNPHNDANLAGELLSLLFRLPPVFDVDPLTLVAVAFSIPDEVFAKIPELGNPELYGPYANLLRIRPSWSDVDFEELPLETVWAIQLIFKQWLARREPWDFAD